MLNAKKSSKRCSNNSMYVPRKWMQPIRARRSTAPPCYWARRRSNLIIDLRKAHTARQLLNGVSECVGIAQVDALLGEATFRVDCEQ